MKKWFALLLLPMLLAQGPLLFADDNDEATGFDPFAMLQRLDEFPHAEQAEFSELAVLDYEVGLGAMKKVRGVWQFKESERVSGDLTRYTWQIIDGFTSGEVMDELLMELHSAAGVESLFECQGRACGHSAQWANRVFQQRLLYGRADLQRYAVYRLPDESRILMYSAARTADRQYLHVELIAVNPGE